VNNDSSDDFGADIQAIQSLLPSSLTTTVLLADTGPTIDSDIISALNSGQALMNYEGHGAEQTWANGLFDNAEALVDVWLDYSFLQLQRPSLPGR